MKKLMVGLTAALLLSSCEYVQVEDLNELEITITVNGKSHMILLDAINNPNHIKYKETAKLIETLTSASKQPRPIR